MAELADVEFSLNWRDEHAAHRDRRFLPGVALESDCLAASPLTPLLLEPQGTAILAQGELLGPRHPEQISRTKRADWPTQVGGITITPRRGRWFPRRLVAAVPSGTGPLRIVAVDGDDITVDLAPPLAGVDLVIEAVIRARRQGTAAAPRELLPLVLADGPGLQAALPFAGTDFMAGNALLRADESADAGFYADPRRVDHLDAVALTELTALHGGFLRPGQQVLDLMASCNSHLPAVAPAISVTGLGMNAEELADNPHLVERVVHDLNASPALPFADARFDLALCALSIEYLIHPVAVVREVARVLKPGGTFLVTFSERWFPPKAIKLWGELHPFERMGLVLDYFRQSAAFGDLHTESLRGLPRPRDDKYIGTTKFSDPVYAVWGTKPNVHVTGGNPRGTGDTPTQTKNQAVSRR